MIDNRSNFPAPFLNERVNLNDPGELLRLVQILELYPLLIDRIAEQDELLQERQDLVLEKNQLLDDFQEQNDSLKNRNNFWFYAAVIGVPLAALLGLGLGVWGGLGLGVSL